MFALLGLALPLRAANTVDSVTVKKQKPYAIQGDQQALLSENLKFPSSVEVYTNGTFKVGKGKIRALEDGQILRRDGWLVNVDGSVEPVCDHVAMKNGHVYVTRDGQTTALAGTFAFANGMTVNADGYCANNPLGFHARLLDGQLLRLDGTLIPAKDTLLFKNGHVVVQKDGTLFTLLPVQSMGLNDGSSVRGNGILQHRDGTTVQLKEGKVVLVEGANTTL